jgi:hypothetical protein
MADFWHPTGMRGQFPVTGSTDRHRHGPAEDTIGGCDSD